MSFLTVTTPEIGGKLEDTITAVVDNFTEQDGYVDERVKRSDSDEDGTTIIPLAIDDLIPDIRN